MKRFAVVSTGVALILMFAAAPSYAQNMSAGVKAGIDFANLGGDVEDTDSKTGFSAGAFFGLDLHEYFRLQFEGQYVQKGTQDDVGEGVTVKWKLDYIEFMVPLTFTIPIQNSPIAPRLYAGPALALEMSCKFGAENGVSIDVNCDEVSEISDGELPDLETKSMDFGVFFGGGVDIGLGGGAITLDVLYNLGMSDINDSQDPMIAGEKIKNKNLQILVGYRFLFGA